MAKYKAILTILITITFILARNSFEYFTWLHDFFWDKSYFIKELFSSLKKIVFYSGPIIIYILSKRESYWLFDWINRRFTNKRVYGIWGLWLAGLIWSKIFLPQYYPSLETSRNLFFYILVVNSIVEEGVFRWFIMAKLEQFYSKIKANIVQAFLFAIIHSPFYISIITKSQNPQMWFWFMLTLCIMLLDVFVLALIRWYIKQKTQSLRPTIVLHSIHNWVVLFFTI